MARAEREYAEAIYLIAAEKDAVPMFLEQMECLAELLRDNSDYLHLLASPAISLNERKGLIDEAFGAHFCEEIVSFVKLLCDNGRIDALLDCVGEFTALARALSGKVQAVVVSAYELDDEQKQKLQKKLQSMFGQEVEAIYGIDPSLIGGVKIEVEGKTYDGTLLRRLRVVKDVMSR